MFLIFHSTYKTVPTCQFRVILIFLRKTFNVLLPQKNLPNEGNELNGLLFSIMDNLRTDNNDSTDIKSDPKIISCNTAVYYLTKGINFARQGN